MSAALGAFPLYGGAPQCPAALMAQARSFAPPRVAIVNAGRALPMQSAREGLEAGVMRPILIGDPALIAAEAEAAGLRLSDVRVVDAPREAAGPAAAALVVAGEADAIMKGHVHTSAFLKALLPSRAGLRAPGARCSHVMHMTFPGSDRPLLITDAALNVCPDLETRQQALTQAVALAQAVGIARPKAAILSASEDVTPGLQSSHEAAAIAAWAAQALRGADVAGPMAIDLALSPEAARIKGYANPVAGAADILAFPEITSANAVFKLMVMGMGACAAGVVLGARAPILLTSRANRSASRLASAALGAIAAGRR